MKNERSKPVVREHPLLKYGVYAGIVAVLAFLLWFSGREGMQADERYSIAPSDVDCVQITQHGRAQARVYDRRDIEKLTGVLNTLIAQNGVSMGDEKIQLGENYYQLEWYPPDGAACLATVDISVTGKVYREKYCFNYIGGEIFDMEYLTALLLANSAEGHEPEPTPEPEAGQVTALYNGRDIAWAMVYGGAGRKGVAVREGEALEQIKAMFGPLTFRRGEPLPEVLGGGITVDLRDKDGGRMIYMGVYPDYVEYQGCGYDWTGGEIDLDLLEEMTKTQPEVTFADTNATFQLWPGKGALGLSSPEYGVSIKSPLMRQILIEYFQPMLFKLEAECGDEAYEEYRYFVDLGSGVDGSLYIMDSQTVMFAHHLYSVVGEEIDTAWLDNLLDPAGGYARRDGMEYHKLGEEATL